MSKLGADDFSGYPAKATEKVDPHTEASTFGKCTVVDGKACISSPVVPTSGLGLGTQAASPNLGGPAQPLGSVETTSGFDAQKPNADPRSAADPTNPNPAK